MTEHTHDLILAHLSGECNNLQLLQKLALDRLANLQRRDILLEIAKQEMPLATRWLL